VYVFNSLRSLSFSPHFIVGISMQKGDYFAVDPDEDEDYLDDGRRKRTRRAKETKVYYGNSNSSNMIDTISSVLSREEHRMDGASTLDFVKNVPTDVKDDEGNDAKEEDVGGMGLLAMEKEDLYKVRTAMGSMLRDGRCRRKLASTRLTDDRVDMFKGLSSVESQLSPEEVELKAHEGEEEKKKKKKVRGAKRRGATIMLVSSLLVGSLTSQLSIVETNEHEVNMRVTEFTLRAIIMDVIQVEAEDVVESFSTTGFENSESDPSSDKLNYLNAGHDQIGKMVLTPPFSGPLREMKGKVAKVVAYCPDEEMSVEKSAAELQRESKNQQFDRFGEKVVMKEKGKIVTRKKSFRIEHLRDEDESVEKANDALVNEVDPGALYLSENQAYGYAEAYV